MFDCCCSSCGRGWLKDKLECTVEETENGIRFNVVPKNLEKRQAFKELVKACREFCETENSCC